MPTTGNYQPYEYKPADNQAAEGIPWTYLDPAEVVVTHIDDATGVSSILQNGTDYVLSGDGRAAIGEITSQADYPADDIFRLTRDTDRKQLNNLKNYENLPPEDVERELDRQALVDEEQDAQTDDLRNRAFLVPDGETAPEFEPAATRSNKPAWWDVAGRLVSVSYEALAQSLLAPLTALLPSSFKGDPGSPGEAYPTRAALQAALDGASPGDDFVLGESGREGRFFYTADDISHFVSADPSQILYIADPNDLTGASGGAVRDYDGRIFTSWAGAKGDGTTDDRAAVLACKTLILALNKTNTTWSNMAVLCDRPDMNHYFPGGINLFPLGRIDFQGVVTMADASDELVYGMLSVLGEPTTYRITQIEVGKVVGTGIMNGRSYIDSFVELVIRADTNTTDQKSDAYSDWYIGDGDTLTIDTISGPNGSPYINENRIHNGRVSTINLGGAYPCNQNHFYGMKMENCTVNFTNGYSNYFHDVRLEDNPPDHINTFNFSAGTYDNWIIYSYHPLRDSYFRDDVRDAFVINDAGTNNHVIDRADSFYRHDVVWEAAPNSRSYDASKFTRGTDDLTFNGNNQIIFDSGLVKLDNDLGLIVEATGASAETLFTPFLYMFDSAGTHITVDPGLDFTSIINGTFSTAGSDPLSLPGYYKTTGPLNKITLPCLTGTDVTYIQLVVRTGGAVDGETFDKLQIIKKELIREHTAITPVIPQYVDHYSFAGAGNGDAVPTSGTWKTGDVVRNTNAIEFGSSPDKFEVVEWHRLTDGSAHVKDTDWRQRRALTGGV